MKVLILGLGGVGIEAAKNLVLAGVNTISLYDHRETTVDELGVNFALTQADVDARTPVAVASQRLISQLNHDVTVAVVQQKRVTVDLLQSHSVVIVTSAYRDLSISELTRINDACRTRDPTPTVFIFALSGGPLGTVFSDFGPHHVSRDTDGVTALQKLVTAVEEKVDGKGRKYSLLRFETPEGMAGGGLRDYTQITFSGAKGLAKASQGGAGGGAAASGSAAHVPSVNDNNEGFRGICGPKDPKGTLRIYPSLVEQGYVTPYEGGAIISEVKETVGFRFDPLSRAMRYPPILMTDVMDWTHNQRLHSMNMALLLFATLRGHGHLPHVNSDEDAEECLRLFREWNASVKAQAELDQSFKNLTTRVHTGTTTASFEPDDSDPEMPARPPPMPGPTAFFLDDGEVPEEFIKRTAKVSGVELQLMSTFLGAVVAQEVVKSAGKYTPISQFLYFDVSSAIPTEAESKALDLAPRGDRYDKIRQVYGNAFVERLANMKLFMAGSGALGCEHIKNLALNGICCGPNGMLTVTDNDRIEISNLSRQFLFHEENVGQPKSVAAGNRAKEMNPAFKVDAKQVFVGAVSEHIFDDNFWDHIDAAVNALDNIPTRLYVDDRCCFHNKVLVESGTTGTAGNVDIIWPGKTNSYSDGGNADTTGGIAMCTLKNFPYLAEHCIEWSRAQFHECFVTPLKQVQQIRKNQAAFFADLKAPIDSATTQGAKLSVAEKALAKIEAAQELVDSLTGNAPTMELCARMAWQYLHKNFRDQINALTRMFPRDARKKNDKGEPTNELFWSGSRRFPTPMSGDMNDVEVRNFMVAATNLFACMLGIHPEKHEPRLNNPQNRWMAQFRREDWIRSVVAGLGGAPAPVDIKVADLDDHDKNAAAAAGGGASASAAPDLNAVLARLDASIERLKQTVTTVPPAAAPLDFEKDDDDNFHIDFIAAVANLRAKNYDIPTKDRLQVKLIAGRIIPAIATTTAAVCGLATLEWFKILLNRDVDALRNSQIDLGSNTYMPFERDPPKKQKTRVIETQRSVESATGVQIVTDKTYIRCIPDSFSKYDRWEFPVTRATTCAEFLEAFKAKVAENGVAASQFTITSMVVGKGLFWSGARHANHTRPIMEVLAGVLGKGKSVDEFWAGRRYCHGFEVVAGMNDDNDSELHVPMLTLVVQ